MIYSFAKLDHISKSENTFFILPTVIMSTMRNMQLQPLLAENLKARKMQKEMRKLGRTC